MNEASKPMRVAQMMTDMNYGGVEMVVMNYYRHIDRTKVQFDFIVLEGSSIPQREEIEELGGKIYVVPRYTHLFQYEKAIQKIFKENRYQIVHSHMNTLSVFSLWGAKKAGVPNRIIHNHSTAGKGETKKNIFKYVLRSFAKMSATQLCACSKYAGEWMFGKNTEFKVIHNAIDLEKYKYDEKTRNILRKELGIENKFVIGHIGRFCFQKNHEFLVEVFDEVCKRREDAVLMLIGEGELENEIRGKVHHLGLDKKVLFLGKKADAYRYYQAMDVFLLPSRYEGLPVVGVEAQAAGLPCVMSDVVTKETKILHSTIFVSIKNLSGQWAEAAIQIGKKYKRRDTSEDIRKAGFEINVEVEKLKQFYYSLFHTN
ncbi:MAG: glycosyltransferase family 1 protein [Roseburia sp.]